jgi:hypothetical protein
MDHAKGSIDQLIARAQRESRLAELTFRVIKERLQDIHKDEEEVLACIEDNQSWSILKEHIKGILERCISSEPTPKSHDPLKKKEPAPKNSKAKVKIDRDKRAKKPKTAEIASPKADPDEEQIKQLKYYILKCGVRKVWKKELEGLSASQSIAKLKNILSELGIEGRPSLAKCEEIKDRLEFEKEMEAIDTRNILPNKKRGEQKEVVSSPEPHKPRLDLSNLGDAD